MNKENRFQMFAAPAGMTGNAQINTRVREMDFVTSFSKDLQDMLALFGITRMIEKQNGETLKTKRVTGVLQSGSVAEGDEIPYSQYQSEEIPFGTIDVEKYRKGVSLEAVKEKGYQAAVADTDEEFKVDLRDHAIDLFYAELAEGTLTSTEVGFQMAFSMALGRVKDKFRKMHRGIKGTVAWVNTLDLYKYLGGASVSMQTAFGFDYIENFLGADVCFVTSDISPGKIYATAINNLVAYYVNPANSEFAAMGLEYTTTGETPFIGVHVEGNYGRALGEMFALMGVKLFAEYLDAIAVITIGGSQSGPSLGSLTLTSALGSEDGQTKLTVTEDKDAVTNIYKYKVGTSAETVAYNQNVKSWAKWDGKSEIVAEDGKTLTLVETNQDYLALKKGTVTVVSEDE